MKGDDHYRGVAGHATAALYNDSTPSDVSTSPRSRVSQLKCNDSLHIEITGRSAVSRASSRITTAVDNVIRVSFRNDKRKSARSAASRNDANGAARPPLLSREILMTLSPT